MVATKANVSFDLQPGDVLDGRYVLREQIAQGGMGSVFLADQPVLERAVAIKLLHPALWRRREHVRQIRDEAIAACQVRHPNCVKILDYSVLPDGMPYLVMEHVPGKSLRQIIAEEVIPLERAIDLLEQILSALAAVHDRGIIHADVKSENFLVERVDGKDHVTMIDFGLARATGSPTSFHGENGDVLVSGTPEYIAPEVIRGRPAIAASDLYSAGVIFYELLTGTTPFSGETPMEIMTRHLQDPVVPPSLRSPERDVPPAIDRVVLRALAKRPRARFGDAATFARRLRAANRIPLIALGNLARNDDRSEPGSPTRDVAVSPNARLPRGDGRGIEAPPAPGGDHAPTIVMPTL
jgi:eukaryotic-like serine/threonine-protein kinase